MKKSDSLRASKQPKPVPVPPVIPNPLKSRDVTEEEVLQIALRNPFRLFNGNEIAALCGIGHDTLTHLRRHKDAPFCAGKTRPELILRWFAEHPGWQPNK